MSERNEPVDPRHEEALAAALHAQAESVRPAGDGLIRIRARVERRRMRTRLLVPIATTAAVAATVTAVVATGILAGSGDNKPSISALDTTSLATVTTTAKPAAVASTPPPAVSAQPSVLATSATVVVSSAVATSTSSPVTSFVAAGGPNGPVPVWPFADKAEADAWQRTAAGSPAQWHLDPRATAVRFVNSLKLPSTAVTGGVPTIDADGGARVDLTRVETSSAKSTVLGTVRLARWSAGVDAPWGVVGVTSPAGAQFPLAITSPAADATVSAPLPVSFTLTGGEDDVYVSAWAAGAASPAATKQTVTSIGRTVTLDSALPSTGSGFVVVADGSTGAGSFKLSRLAVTPVSFGAGAPAAPTYVAVVAGRMQVYDASTNTEVRPLAGDATDVTHVAVSDDRQWVYYLQSSGPCGAGTLMRTRLDGTGSPEKVDTGSTSVGLFAIAGDHAQQLSWLQLDCQGAWTLGWRTAQGAGHLSAPNSPPVPESLSISPDGSTVAANVKTGLESNVQTYALATARSVTDGSAPAGCTTPGVGCSDATYAADGDLVYVQSDGQQLTVSRNHGGGATQLFHVAAAYGQPTVDLNPTGTEVLLTDGLGHAWSWAGSGSGKSLPGTITDASW
jgi:hypothetical protein